MIEDIREMLEHHGILKFLQEADLDTKETYLKFRNMLLLEEYTELVSAEQNKNPEEFVDALIDMLVIILGTLHSLDVDIPIAWGRVYEANMSKEVGTNTNREVVIPGMPDLVKPKLWEEPKHSDNIGDLNEIFNS